MAIWLREIAEKVAGGETCSMTVRDLLGRYDAKRRGQLITEQIYRDLNAYQLSVNPELTEGYLDTQLVFGKRDVASAKENVRDFKLKVSNLKKYTSEADVIEVGESVAKAEFKMTLYNYSQLPVVNNKKLCGVIRLIDVQKGKMLKARGERSISDLMLKLDDVPRCKGDDSFFQRMPSLIEHGYLIITKELDENIEIITAYDLNVFFKTKSEPMLLLEEIERNIKVLVEKKASIEVKAFALSDPSVKNKGLQEYTMGDLQHCLSFQAVWDKLGICVSKDIFIEQFKVIREVRNDLMHFNSSPDDLSEAEINGLKMFSDIVSDCLGVGERSKAA